MDKEQEQKNAKDIALIMQDIGYIKEDTKEIKQTLKLVLEKYVQREEVEARLDRINTEIDKRFEGVHHRVDVLEEKKANQADYKELEITVKEKFDSGQIKWGAIFQAVITAVIVTVALSQLK